MCRQNKKYCTDEAEMAAISYAFAKCAEISIENGFSDRCHVFCF